ncbi:aldehyde dehydrogenase [Clostridium butyricum]|uniref:aldehyde dehydrogenase n=1 Tax=Clostridium butyricum TaxID=1492 RepID=UPI000903C3B8|nr:aldehyde dehydrogenase [Clostridium butyricum]APF23609.1 acyl-CoA reductase family protein [Clostridium butyricum]
MGKSELMLDDVMEILNNQKKFFYTNKTKDINFRINSLKNLKKVIKKYENEIIKALNNDLGKHEFESYTTEVGFIYSSIEDFIKNIKKWSRPKKVKTPIFLQPAKSIIINEPYGTVLIIGPFNYPFQLIIEPLIGALAAGNTAVVKPSEMCPNVSMILMKIINEAFDPEYVACVEGAVETSSNLLKSHFDYIFFTGSERSGKIVMENAAKNLIPVTLELGGKSPVIVDKTANIDNVAKRIIWGKTVNNGQTCVAPDYVLVHNDVINEFIKKAKQTIKEFYGEDISNNKDYGRIINENHFNRLKNIIDKEKENIIFGGNYNKKDMFIEPTLIVKNAFTGESMSQEIFGPILPIIGYDNIDEAIKQIKGLSKPLALYLFTEDVKIEKHILNEISSGGVCINDTITHLANSNLPFGGVGSSGMGSYHGEESYSTFSHKRSILKKSSKISFTMLFPPYNKSNLKLVKKFLK